MQEKRGILGGEKDNMVKSQPKKEVNNLYTHEIIINTIHTFNELFSIQTQLAIESESLDLMLIRQFYFLADKCLFIIGPDASDHLRYFYMSHEDYYNLRTSQIEYIKRYY